MRVQKRRFLNLSFITLLSAAAISANRTPSAAQEPAPPAGKTDAVPVDASNAPLDYLSVLRAAPYDPAERGPLLMLIPQPFIDFKTTGGTRPPRLRSLSDLAQATSTRLFAAGQMNVLAPQAITVINTKPGKANPFGDLSPSDALKLLLSTFTSAQWKQAGGATGIGAGDLTDDQKALWGQMLPEQTELQKSKIEAGDKPHTLSYADSTFIAVHPRSTGRLRLSKTVTFSLYKPGGTDTLWSGDPYMGQDRVGETKTMIVTLASPVAGKLPASAYGVPLLIEQPNRLKSGSIDFAAPVLDKRIVLSGFPVHEAETKNNGAPSRNTRDAAEERAENDFALLPTVGELLERITKTTGVEFVADKRVRDLSVYLRGDNARTGDVLMALALSIGGTYRKMEPDNKTGETAKAAPLYLLTDDVEGIGARVAWLAEWAEAADELKRRITNKADEAAAKNDPLAYLSFAPNDVFALSSAQTKRIENIWRKEKYGSAPDAPTSELSPALKKAVQDFVNDRADEGVSLRADRVRIGEELRPYLLFPEVEGVALEAQQLKYAIGNQYLQVVAFDPSKKPLVEDKKTKPVSPAPALGFNAPGLLKQRRILVARPQTDDEAVQIVRTAIGRGITEVWLEASLADSKGSAARLTKATTAVDKKIAVGALVRLLREKNGASTSDLGEPDRNILNETGDEHRTRAINEHANDKAALAYYEEEMLGFAGWSAIDGASAPDAAELRRRVGLIANVPNLSGLTFRATGGPGWTGQKQGGDALSTNTAQGYTAVMRRAFLRGYGIDPIDIPDLAWQLREIQWNVGYFAENDGSGEYALVNGKAVLRNADADPHTAWWSFRKKRNTELMASVFKTVRKEHATLPLYIDDRISSYASSNTEWLGSWDTPDGLPNTNPYEGESDTRETARHTSKAIFDHWVWWWRDGDAAKPDVPATFARVLSASARQKAPPAWEGIVIDLSNVPGASVPALLESLPKITPRP